MSIADDLKAKVTPWVTQVATDAAKAAGRAREKEVVAEARHAAQKTIIPKLAIGLGAGLAGLISGVIGAIMVKRARR